MLWPRKKADEVSADFDKFWASYVKEDNDKTKLEYMEKQVKRIKPKAKKVEKELREEVRIVHKLSTKKTKLGIETSKFSDSLRLVSQDESEKAGAVKNILCFSYSLSRPPGLT